MNLLYDIQKSIIQNVEDIGSILLKLRLLAARLNSVSLEEWVKHELEGYPEDIDVPSYRIIEVSYKGTFSGPFGSGLKNAPIPSSLIEKLAGEEWTKYKIRQSIAGIDELLKVTSGKGVSLEIDASNLILLLQGEIYPDYVCNEVKGKISRAALAEVRHSVKNRILELTIRIEKEFPEVTEITFDGPKINEKINNEEINKISTHVIYNVANITAGNEAHIDISFGKGDNEALIRYLVKHGILEEDAKKLLEILASEKPTGKDEPFGSKAKEWLIKNIKKAVDGTWEVGISVAINVLTEAAMKYYGLK